jgi:hypothetical protein
MNAFDYLSILTSIVLAIGITRLLSGVGILLQKRKQITIYWVHLLWTLNVFLFLVLNWWILFRWQGQQEWNFFLFSFLLLSPTIAFLLSVILYPDISNEKIDYKQHFYTNHRWFFSLAALLPLIDVVDTLLKGYSHFLAQGPLYIITIILIFSLSLLAALTKNEKYHKSFAVFFLLYILMFISINLNILA